MSANRHFKLFLLFWFHSLALLLAAASAESISQEQMQRGNLLYARYCFMCHQSSGQGASGIFPPLAKSDFLGKDKDRSIRILITGLSGAISVNNNIYNGVMPPAPYNDEQLADVLTYVQNSFGNSNGPVTTAEVQKIHKEVAGAQTVAEPYPYPPLPKAPESFTLREVVRMPNHPTRMASDGKGKVLYVLCENGDVWRVEIATGALQRILAGEDYACAPGQYVNCVGMTLDEQKRLYIVANFRHDVQPVVMDEVTIYRTTTLRDGEPADPKPWLQTNYPWGVGSFNHSVGNISTGPDGFLYVTSGSRTDGGEAGTDPHYSQAGETPITATIWRLNPRVAENPKIEIFARGVRNPYGFCWNDKGEMFATENGPNADAPEELNQIKPGGHYGFPYQFSNWTNKVYDFTPTLPPGLKMTVPIANFGPDAGGSPDKPLYTFQPHSSPGGIVFLGPDFPPGYRGTYLVTRWGNVIKTSPTDVGFDLLQIRLKKNNAGVYDAQVKQLIAPLARPIDIHLAGKGKVYIAEYTRVLDDSGRVPMMPGRILELAVKSDNKTTTYSSTHIPDQPTGGLNR